ncbi:MAG: NUDIX hydrolase [Thermoanaerobaculia bacterium]
MPKRKEHCYEFPRPAVTVDVVLFRPSTDGHEVLLIRRGREPFRGRWAFPGGFVDPFEPLERAARRELREETGLTRIRLEQLAAFGDPGRDPRGHTISIVFTGTVGGRRRMKAADDADEVQWFAVNDLPPLAFDHAKILRHALREGRER